VHGVDVAEDTGGPSIGIPNIRDLHRRDLTNLMARRIATSSLPHVKHSTELRRSLHANVGAELQKMSIPVCDRLMILSPA
jgi:hypothetical protein